MLAIGQLHSARVEVIVSAHGTVPCGPVKVSCVATFELLPGSALPKTVEVSATWPNVNNARLEDLAYNLLWQLDHQIGKTYEQRSLME